MTTIYNCVSVSKFQPSADARAAIRAELGIGLRRIPSGMRGKA